MTATSSERVVSEQRSGDWISHNYSLQYGLRAQPTIADSCQVGGPSVMCGELRPDIIVQVILFEGGAHPAMNSFFTILGFDQPFVPGLVYIEELLRNIYLGRPTDMERHRKLLPHLRSMTVSPARSISLISRIATSGTGQD